MESLNKRASPSGSGMTAKLSPTARPWAHLSPDLLLDISSRLDDAADFARFHAVCMPWRAAAPSQHSPAAATLPAFPSWLLGLCLCEVVSVASSKPINRETQIVRSNVDLRRVMTSFEKAGAGCVADDVVLAEPQGGASCTGGGRNWVASADGTAAWLFVASPEPRLVDLLTGAVNALPLFPDDDELTVPMKNFRGIVYRDGTVFLYSFLDEKAAPTFTASILRPGDTTWTVMRRILEVPIAGRRSGTGVAMYHDGEVLVCVDYFWSLLPQGGLGGFAGLHSRWSQKEEDEFTRECNYLLESRGELLWASVLKVKRDLSRPYARDLTLSLSVHALKKEAGGKVRWARMDGWSLADRVLFLGCPASFAADAHQLGMVGGCAFFVSRGCVFRYSLVDDKAELVKKLSSTWGMDGAGVWLPRQPILAPIQEIQDVMSLYPNKKQKVCN